MSQRYRISPQGRTPLSDAEVAARPDDPPSLADFPEVRRSVVNYGVPSFSGRSSRDFDREALAREIQAILACFEPRLKASATKVTVATADRNAGLRIEIDALLIMAPAPERLRLRVGLGVRVGLSIRAQAARFLLHLRRRTN